MCQETPVIHAGEEWPPTRMGMWGRQVAGDEPACLVRQHALALLSALLVIFPYGRGFLGESPQNSCSKSSTLGLNLGEMTLRGCSTGIGPRPSASAWQEVV